jgi:predicted ArsR family transcriptional regulator
VISPDVEVGSPGVAVAGYKQRTRVAPAIRRRTSQLIVSTIAERASCTDNTVKKHLDRFVDMGIVDRNEEFKMATPRRSSAYIERWIAQRIASDHSVSEIIARIEELEEKQMELEADLDGTDLTPNTIYMVESISPVSEQLEAVTEWRHTEQRIRYRQLAYQISRFDGHFMPRMETNTLPKIADVPE